MNFAFELQEDKVLRDNNALQPFRIVSLLDTLRFYARGFVRICSNLGHCSGIINALAHPKYSVDLGEIEEEIKELVFHSRASGLTISAGNAEVLLEHIEYLPNQNNEKQHYDEIRGKLDSLIQTVLHELDDKTMLMLSPTNSHFYDEKGTFLGQDTIDKFKELERDAIEAGNCFAAGRYTACVFHLMRIMERLVQDFASNVGAEITHKGKPVEIKYAEWHEIEDAIQAKIKDMPKGERKSRCNAAVITLSAVRLGVRNEVMHPRGFYDEEDARKLLSNVKSFVCEVLTLPPS